MTVATHGIGQGGVGVGDRAGDGRGRNKKVRDPVVEGTAVGTDDRRQVVDVDLDSPPLSATALPRDAANIVRSPSVKREGAVV